MTISSAPFNDDFDPTKNHLQMLFHPERPVQARELTGLQSILSNQIGVHAKHIFKDGTQVVGGQLTVKRIMYMIVEDTYGGFPVVLEEFADKAIVETDDADVETTYTGTVMSFKESGADKIIFAD